MNNGCGAWKWWKNWIIFSSINANGSYYLLTHLVSETTDVLLRGKKTQHTHTKKLLSISLSFSCPPSVSTSVSQEKQLQCHNSFVSSSIQIKHCLTTTCMAHNITAAGSMTTSTPLKKRKESKTHTHFLKSCTWITGNTWTQDIFRDLCIKLIFGICVFF